MAVLGASVYGRDGYGNTDELYITDRTENDLRNNTYKAYLNPEHMQWLNSRVQTLYYSYLGSYPPLDFKPTSNPFTYLYADGVGVRSANELARQIKNLVNRMTTYKPEFEIPDNLNKADIYTVNNLERAVRDMWGDR